MNIYAVTMIASTLTIPLAILYRVLNPIESAEVARKRLDSEAWDIERKTLPKNLSRGSLSPCRNDAQWIDNQWVPNELVPVVPVVPRFVAYEPSPIVEKIATYFGYSIGCLVLGVPAILLAGWIGFHALALGVLIVWGINSFKDDVATAVAEKIAKK